jgi:hypothetical protein
MIDRVHIILCLILHTIHHYTHNHNVNDAINLNPTLPTIHLRPSDCQGDLFHSGKGFRSAHGSEGGSCF